MLSVLVILHFVEIPAFLKKKKKVKNPGRTQLYLGL